MPLNFSSTILSAWDEVKQREQKKTEGLKAKIDLGPAD